MKTIAKRAEKLLLIGYGNPGRLDDGLGPALAERVSALNLPNLKIESDYQLNLEDAADISGADIVIFADAGTDGPEPFALSKIEPGSEPLGFTSHRLSPQQLLTLCRDLYGKTPAAYLLEIRGYEFNEFGERLSRGALANLDAAVLEIKAFVAGLKAK